MMIIRNFFNLSRQSKTVDSKYIYIKEKHDVHGNYSRHYDKVGSFPFLYCQESLKNEL